MSIWVFFSLYQVEWCFYGHKDLFVKWTYFYFQSSNSRSEPFILFSILICAWRPNFTFFWIFLLFIKMGTKFNGLNLIFFVPILINSKQIQKNVKFGLQAHINMENKMNGSDRPFGFWNFKFGPCVFRAKCYRKHISPSLYIHVLYYIYIYIHVE